jgi:hypothetical protein
MTPMGAPMTPMKSGERLCRTANTGEHRLHAKRDQRDFSVFVKNHKE